MKLILIDAMGLVFRSYYAMSRAQLTTPDGKPIGAAFGFTKMLVKILQELHPTHLAVVWDLKEKTFRHHLSADYKANRGATPDDLLPQLPILKSLLAALHVPMVSCAGFEADDVIGTLAARFASENCMTYIVSSDKDFMQLVNTHINIVSLKAKDNFEVLGRQAVEDYFGVLPEQVIDYLAITGDSVDNVPGIKGVGPKGAKSLIQQFGSLDTLLTSSHLIGNPRLRQLVEDSRAQLLLSRQLVTIHTEVPIEHQLADLSYSFSDMTRAEEGKIALSDLGMNSIVKAVFPEQTLWAEPPSTSHIQSSRSKTESSAHVDRATAWGQRSYQTVKSRIELDALLKRIETTATPFAFDTETTGLDVMADVPIGFSVAFEPGQAFYVPVWPETHGSPDGMAPSEIWQLLGASLKRRKQPLVAHNLKFDAHVAQNIGVDLLSGPYACSMVAAWILNSSSGGFGLDALALSHFGLAKIPTKELLSKPITSMVQVSLDTLSEYACEDADATLRLWVLLNGMLEKDKALQSLFFSMEMPILSVLLKMERDGVALHPDTLGDLAIELQDRLSQIESEIFKEVGTTFNLASPRQLGQVLFETLKVHEAVGFKGKLLKTTLGFKTDAGTLEQFSAHPVVARVQEYRELAKLLNTYVLKLPQLLHPKTGRLHTSFHQIGTATGRLSSSDPNLQNIPIRTRWGKRVRAAFAAPSSTHVILSADYSQIELRVLAHLAKDPTMIEAFHNNADIHRQTAALIWGKRPEEVSKEERSRAKAINFGIIYGMGPQRLAKDQGITVADAKAFIDKYFLNFSCIREFLDRTKQIAHHDGGVRTAFGRWRPIPGLKSDRPLELRAAENVAINTPIQGTAADIMKLGMLKVAAQLQEKNLRAKLILQVHDELVFEVPVEELETVASVVKEALEHVVEFAVPMTVDVSSGPNWLEA